MLNVISKYRSLPLEEKLKFRLERRLHPYLSMFNLNGELKEKVNEALKALDRSSPEAERRVDEAIHLLRHPFI